MRIDEDRIGAYAAELPEPPPAALDPETALTDGDRESRAAFWICLDAINFGSGWWPTIRKLPGRSGYLTVAAGVAEQFREVGPWAPVELAEIDAPAIAAILGQDPDHPLMADFAASLRDVGTRVTAEYDGSFAAVVDAAAGSAPALADLLSGWDAFADASTYMEREVPFFKRAQIVAADIARAAVAPLVDLDRLTLFADNLIPHVLRVDGVIEVDPGLTARIEAGELLVHGSAEEVELRAAAVHVAELLSAARANAGLPHLNAAQVDAALWHRGAAARYKDRPRPRCRCTAY